jgi:elongation factor G
MSYSIEQIRNLVLVGHSGAGKTCLSEAMVYCAGGISRMGRVDEGNTLSDFDSEEVDRKISLRTSLLGCEWNRCQINIMDTPGYSDFLTESQSSIRVAESGIVVIDAAHGPEIGSERVWAFADEYNVPCVVFINKLDRDDLDLDGVLAQVQQRFGRQVVPLQLSVNSGPGFNQIVDLVSMRLLTYTEGRAQAEEVPDDLSVEAEALRQQLVEAVAETDEELMEKYFSEGELAPEDFISGLKKAIGRRELFPVFYGDAYNAVGVAELLDAVVAYTPSPSQSSGLKLSDGSILAAEAEAPLCALVFKTVVEHHVGELSLLRLYAGTLKAGDDAFNVSRQTNERIGQIYRLNGKERVEVDRASAGDIVALVKLKDTHTGNTLCAKGSDMVLPAVQFPEPLIRVAVSAKEKGQEDRMGAGLTQLHEEDPSFIFRYDPDIRQSLILAQGELHLEILLHRLKQRFSVEIEQEIPRVPYMETVRGKAESHYRHKKQSGGRGQFGEVYLRLEAKERGEGFEFINKVVGGSIPSNFIPAVEKGLVECLDQGPLSKSKVVDIGVELYDGKHHPVDSDEVSFRIAASHAFREAFLKANPILLEPIYHITVTVPEEFMGDVMGDLSAKRGRVQGMETDGHSQVIRAEMPLAELDRYATTLRSMTQGRGIHAQEFDRYEEVPHEIMEKILAEAKQAAL